MKFSVRKECTLFEFLQAGANASGTKIRKRIKHGDVRVNGRTVLRPDALVSRVKPLRSADPRRRRLSPCSMRTSALLPWKNRLGYCPSVRTEKLPTRFTGRLIITSKSVPREGTDLHRPPPGPGVSGVMLSPSPKPSRSGSEKLEHNRKTLFCLVEGHPPEKKGASELAERESDPQGLFVPEGPHAKYAVTRYRERKRYPTTRSWRQTSKQDGRIKSVHTCPNWGAHRR